jgi:predicted transcriptional regulator of viral defense system
MSYTLEQFSMKPQSSLNKLAMLAERSPVIRSSDAASVGVSSAALTRLTRSGALERLGRGLYHIAGSEWHANPDIVEASVLVPKGVIVLVSALAFHGIGTHMPRGVWMLLPANCRAPKVRHPALRIVRSRKPETFVEGVETHMLDGYPVRITNVDRTIVDCFKHRSLVSLELCIEALRERMQHRRHSLVNMHRYAKMMGMSRVMQPYLEVLA